MPACIVSLATATADFFYSQHQTTEWIAEYLGMDAAEKHQLTLLHRATGVASRASVLPDFGQKERLLYSNKGLSPDTASRMQAYKKLALPLACKAIDKCLIDSDKDSFTHLILVSCTGMYAPGLDIDLVQRLGLPTSIHRTAITFMGCYGAFTGLKLAASIASADSEACVLVVCVELCTLHFQLDKSADSLLSSALFADGAAAAVVRQSSHGLALENFQTVLLPQGQKEMTWEVSNSGFIMGLSGYVPDLIAEGIGQLLGKLTVTQADWYAIHPGGKKILQAVEQVLHLDKEQNRFAYEVLKQQGNMSSATFLFVLERIWLAQRGHNQTVLGMAFGPGLTIESALMRFLDS